MPDSAVRIALVFPSLLGTYGDGGNASVLAQRLRWRGIDADVVDVAIDAPLPEQADLYVLGGGEDAAQTLAVTKLGDGSMRRVVDAGKTVFAVCAGFQILGDSFVVGQGASHSGLGVLDCRTERLPGARAVGELLDETEPDLGLGLLTGYENHGGQTILGPAARPFAGVRHGIGNGTGGVDGALQAGIVATYLHGPALARNPRLADFLLTRVVGDELAPLDDGEEEALREERFAFLRRERRSWWRRQWRPPARDT